MFRFAMMSVALAAVGTSAYAQSTTHPRSTRPAVAPAAQAPDDPQDVTTVPRNVQKWIGGAVDEILTGADKAIEPGKDTR